MTGTSTRTPTVVASATGLFTPNKATVTATDNSKKFEPPIIAAGAAMLCGNRQQHGPGDRDATYTEQQADNRREGNQNNQIDGRDRPRGDVV